MKKIYFIPILLLLITILFNINSTNALEVNRIKIDIKGAVVSPGVYEVDAGSTVYDVIALSGGLREYADTSLINLSKRLTDEDVIIIYTIDEVKSFKEGNTAIKVIDTYCTCPKVENVSCINKPTNNILVNINTASVEELQKLSGIGKSKAEAIILYRKTKPFTKIEDIMNVKGIGKTMYEKIKDNITV